MREKILIVDDEPSIVTLLTYNLEHAGFQTESARDGEEAINKVLNNEFDFIVLDLMLPKMDGMAVCKYLRQNQINTPILMLTARGEESSKIEGLELGADDYLIKPFSPKEVIARIKAILRRTSRSSFKQYDMLRVGSLSIYPEKHEAMIDDELLSFTRKEFELLLYLTKHLGKVISRSVLLSEVWNYDMALDTRIVDVHISRIREKIEENTKQPTYIKTMRGLGYKMEEPTS